jgi:heme/copper-type cytochrome/quinol oxidase subunit 2
MAQTLLTIAVVATVVAVVAAIFVVLWRERTSEQTARAAVISRVVLAAWAAVTSRLASSGFSFRPTRSARRRLESPSLLRWSG